MELRINTTWAQIGIEQTRPLLRTETDIPDLQVETTFPQVQLQRQEARLTIDQSHIWEELGFRDYRAFTEHTASLGWERAAQGVRRKVEEGNRLAQIEDGGNPIPAIARENYTDLVQINLTLWPTRPPVIEVDPGGLEIAMEEGQVNSLYRPAQVGGRFTWGVVDVYLQQEPGIEVEVVLDRRI